MPLFNTKSKCEIIPYGVFLYRQCLSLPNQKKFLDLCIQLSNHEANKKLLVTKPGEIPKFAQPVLFYRWAARPESIKIHPEPTEILNLGKHLKDNACKLANDERLQHLPNYLRLPRHFDFKAMYGIVYPRKGEFGAHLDGANSWAIAISLGASADFFYYTPEGCSHINERIREYEEQNKAPAPPSVVSDAARQESDSNKISLRLDSGDAVLFNGGQLYHGVSRIYDNLPPFWDESIYSSLGVRFNLQFRDPENDTLTYDPYFKHSV